jgi:two-component system response regulator PilR (NtrC family)
MSEQAARPEYQYLIGLITEKGSSFAEIQQTLSLSFRTCLAGDETEILTQVQDRQVHAFLVDLDCTDSGPEEATDILTEIRRVRADAVLVALSQSISRTLPVRASRAGADEFFRSPPNMEELKVVLTRAIEKKALEIEGRRLVDQVENKIAFCGMVGRSDAMQNIYRSVQRVADGNSSVVLRGESGTGKEMVAKAIVESGNRRDKPFVSLNCSALPETLIESELFGYEKGAFTGADAAKPGLIESAHTGTLFLDEITTLNHNLQAKLLRVLQERTVQRLGGRTAHKLDFRLITATNEDLEDCMRKGRFREDLYFRINVVPIFVPPLRERRGDIPLLVDHFLRVYCAANTKPLKHLHPTVIEILEDYKWPGNVRELENTIHRLVVMSPDIHITPEHLPQHLLTSSAAAQEAILIPSGGVDFDSEIERIQIAYLNAALNRTGGKKSAAAALLRIDPQRMKYLCRKLDLQKG